MSEKFTIRPGHRAPGRGDRQVSPANILKPKGLHISGIDFARAGEEPRVPGRADDEKGEDMRQNEEFDRAKAVAVSRRRVMTGSLILAGWLMAGLAMAMSTGLSGLPY